MEMYKLTKETLSAFRNCDRIVLSCSEEERKADVCLKKEERHSSGFTGTLSVEFSTECRFTIYETGGSTFSTWNSPYYHKAFFGLANYPHQRKKKEGALQLVLSLLRVDDEISFSVLAGNNTQAMNEAGFSCDELRISVYRNGKPLFTDVLIDYSTTSNDLSRPVKRDKRKPEPEEENAQLAS